MLLRFLLPSPCLGCGRIDPPRGMALCLCPGCRGGLRPLAGPRCRRCLVPLPGADAALAVCGACRRRRAAPEPLLAGWDYLPPLDAVVHGLKFGGLAFLGRELAAALHRRFAAQLAVFDLVVPVPLHWRRRLRRGYNQAAQIGRPLARRLAVPCRDALRRRRATAAQARLPHAARRANLRRAFIVVRPDAVRGRGCLLVDDVVTTGATLAAAAAALRRAGAASVAALVAARTPQPGELPGAVPWNAGGGSRCWFENGAL